MPPPSCAAPAAGAVGGDSPPPQCCQDARCQHRPGTPEKWRWCRQGAGGANGWPGQEGCGSAPHNHSPPPPALPGDGSWYSRTLSRLSGGGGAACKRVGGATPDRSLLWHPLSGAPSTGCNPPNPLGRPHGCWLLALARCGDGGAGATPPPRPVLQGCMKGPFVPPTAGRTGVRWPGWWHTVPPCPPPPRHFAPALPQGSASPPAPAPFARPHVNDPPARTTAASSPQQPPRRAVPSSGGRGSRAGGPRHGRLGGPAAPCPAPHPSVSAPR